MSVLAVPGSMDMTHTCPRYSAARAEVKAVTYALEAEYTVIRGTVSSAERLLMLIMQQPPRLHMDGMSNRIISCMAEMFTCKSVSKTKERKAPGANTDNAVNISRRMVEIGFGDVRQISHIVDENRNAVDANSR